MLVLSSQGQEFMLSRTYWIRHETINFWYDAGACLATSNISSNDVRLVFAEIMSQTIKGAKTKKIMLSSCSLRRRHETIFFLSYDGSLKLGRMMNFKVSNN